MCTSLNYNILTIFKIIDALLKIARIAVPLIIIVPSIFEVGATSISSDPSGLKKALSKVGVRIIAGLIVFLIPAFTNLAFNVIHVNIADDGLSCILNVNDEMILESKLNSIEKSLEKADEKTTKANIDMAKSLINSLSDGDANKSVYMARVKVLEDKYASTEKVYNDERSKDIENYNNNKNAQEPSNGTVYIGGNTKGDEIVAYANKWVGSMYVWGGPGGRTLTMEECKAQGTGTDCSGFVTAVYKHFGYNIGKNGVSTYGLINEGVKVNSLSEAKPGDLIFYGISNHHVAIYMGNNKIVEAQSSNTGITNNRNANNEYILAIRRIII